MWKGFEGKVFIPCAGTGSRLGAKTRYLNKALMSVGLQPVISRILKQVPKDLTVVLALGHRADTLKEFLTLGYPDRKFEFAEVSPYEGNSSGLGLSILQSAHLLDCPFLFWSCDTLIAEEMPSFESNWLGVSDLPQGREKAEFRCADRVANDPKVIELYRKGHVAPRSLPYIGLSYIADHRRFFAIMRAGGQDAVQEGESFGICGLIREGQAFQMNKFASWHDTGSIRGLSEANKFYQKPNAPHILEKPNEAIWFVGENVFKFCDSHDFIEKRFNRAKLISDFVPVLIGSTKTIYAYKKVSGETLSHHPSPTEFRRFLVWMTDFWSPAQLDGGSSKTFTKSCDSFYREKTLERIAKFHELYPTVPTTGTINGIATTETSALLSTVPWAVLARGIATRFHGDLHFENILRTSDPNRFCLLDWRQDFAGIMEYGDIYYDLAKLNHGFIVNHGIIESGRFKLDCGPTTIDFELETVSELMDCQRVLRDHVDSVGLSFARVELLTSLIFLNIAALHHDPYSKMLYGLGKQMLSKTLKENKWNISGDQKAF